MECLNALYQLGIAVQLALLPASRYTFADQAEALADLRWRLRLPASPEYDRSIQAAMAELLGRTDDGRLEPRGQPDSAAVIWWEHS